MAKTDRSRQATFRDAQALSKARRQRRAAAAPEPAPESFPLDLRALGEACQRAGPPAGPMTEALRIAYNAIHAAYEAGRGNRARNLMEALEVAYDAVDAAYRAGRAAREGTA